jgi:DNA-binding transcriptional ArsR family regulator
MEPARTRIKPSIFIGDIYEHMRICLYRSQAPVFFQVMAKKLKLSDDALVLVARRFAVLAEPMRLRLIQALFEGEKNVNALVAETSGTQANVSRHLQKLTHEHILSRRKEGMQVFYTIADESIYQLCELVCGRLKKTLTQQAVAFRRGQE